MSSIPNKAIPHPHAHDPAEPAHESATAHANPSPAPAKPDLEAPVVAADAKTANKGAGRIALVLGGVLAVATAAAAARLIQRPSPEKATKPGKAKVARGKKRTGAN